MSYPVRFIPLKEERDRWHAQLGLSKHAYNDPHAYITTSLVGAEILRQVMAGARARMLHIMHTDFKSINTTTGLMCATWDDILTREFTALTATGRFTTPLPLTLSIKQGPGACGDYDYPHLGIGNTFGPAYEQLHGNRKDIDLLAYSFHEAAHAKHYRQIHPTPRTQGDPPYMRAPLPYFRVWSILNRPERLCNSWAIAAILWAEGQDPFTELSSHPNPLLRRYWVQAELAKSCARLRRDNEVFRRAIAYNVYLLQQFSKSHPALVPRYWLPGY